MKRFLYILLLPLSFLCSCIYEDEANCCHPTKVRVEMSVCPDPMMTVTRADEATIRDLNFYLCDDNGEIILHRYQTSATLRFECRPGDYRHLYSLSQTATGKVRRPEVRSHGSKCFIPISKPRIILFMLLLVAFVGFAPQGCGTDLRRESQRLCSMYCNTERRGRSGPDGQFWSLELSGYWNPVKTASLSSSFHAVQLGGRYWFYESFVGHFFGQHLTLYRLRPRKPHKTL